MFKNKYMLKCLKIERHKLHDVPTVKLYLYVLYMLLII